MRVRDPRNQDAWQQFVDIYAPVVRSYCFQRKIQVADISDIEQDVMSRVSKAIRAFEYDPAKGKFRAWLGTITANRIRSFFAKEVQRHENEQAAFMTEIPYSDPDSDWVAIFSERVFTIACSRIREQTSEVAWRCFEATWIEKAPATEVAENLGIPTHSVYVHKSRVLKQLEYEVGILVDDVPIPNTSR